MSDYGFQFYNAAGQLVLDISDKILAFNGRLWVPISGAASGSVYNDGFLNGNPFAIITEYPLLNYGSGTVGYSDVFISISGNRLDWLVAGTFFGSLEGYLRLIYGYY